MTDDPYSGVVMPVVDATYTARIINSPLPVLLAFATLTDTADQAYRQVLAEVAAHREGAVRVAVIDPAGNPASSSNWGITRTPTTLLLAGDVLQRVLLGARPTARLLDDLADAGI